MSIFNILKRALPKSKNSIYTASRRKNFLFAPVIAYSLDTSCRHEATIVLPQSRSFLTKNTNLTMTKQWLYLQRRSVHTTPPPPHLPTSKEELLAQARGFFERLKIRIKYPLMRQIRPWTLNDATALFSWLFLGHTVWLLAGTTSFVSIILWTANSLQFQCNLLYIIFLYLLKKKTNFFF